MTLNYDLQPIYIAGPTASGKSEAALRLADEFDSVIISADSMQIYKGLDIGTAKVSEEIREKYPHKMIDIVGPEEEFSVAQFAEMANEEIKLALNANKLPIVVGGTGLYFESLLYPQSFGHTYKNEDLRKVLQSEYEKYGAAYLHEKLKALDVETANRLHQNDVKRVIRALEIISTTGKTLKENADTRKDPNVIMIAFNTDRQKLYERIDKRVDIMFEEGLVNEVLFVGNFEYQSMQAIGYKEFSGYEFKFDGKNYVLNENDLQSVKSLIKQHTRNYAKRQITWFKRYNFIKWFECGDYDGATDYVKTQMLACK